MALQLKGSTGFNIQNNTISGYGTGIDMYDCGITQSGLNMLLTSISNNNVSDCSIGIEVYSSSANFTKNHIDSCFAGVRLLNNSYTNFGTPSAPNSLQNCQTIENFSTIGFYASENSFPTLFRYNRIFKNSNDNIYRVSFWWDFTGLTWTLYDIMHNCWGLNFNHITDLYDYSVLKWNPRWLCELISWPRMQGADETLYETALEYFANEDYFNAETTFKELIETYPESQFAIAALHELFALEQFTNNDFAALQSYFTSIAPEDTMLFNAADFLATRCYVKDKIWQPAIDWYEYRIENPPSYQDSIFAVIDLGDIHLKMEAEMAADTTNGNGEFAKVMYRFRPDLKLQSKKEYEEKKTALLATLPQIKKPQTDHPQTPQTGKPQTDKKGALGQNTPNPATGITTIGYDIYTEGIVEIKIYNMLGQVMQTLSQGKQQPGSYQAKVTVSGMPAGIYHYALFVNGEKVDAKKMVVN